MKKYRITLAILALAAIALVFTLVNKQPMQPVLGSMIIDVNPSIELKVNRDMEVQSLKALNQEAVQVLTGYVLQEDQDDIEDVVEAIVERLIELNYLESEKENMILVTGDKHLDEKILEVANASIKQYLRIKKIEAKVASQHAELSAEEQKQAQELKVSSGKYELIKQLLKHDDDLDIKELVKLELKDLYHMAINQTGEGIAVTVQTPSVDDDYEDTQTPVVETPRPVETKVDDDHDEIKTPVVEAPRPVEPKDDDDRNQENVVDHDDDDDDYDDDDHDDDNDDDDDDDDKQVVVVKPVITVKKVQEVKSIAFKTINREDATLAKGTTKVSQAGVNGQETWTYELTYQDGKEVSKKLIAQTVTKKPVDKIVLVGTKVATVVTPPATTTRLSALAARNMVTNRFGGAIQKIEYTYNESNPLYKGEARKAGQKVVFEINARTKAFVKWDVGNDSEYTDWATRYQTPSIMTQAADKVVARSGVAHTFVQKIEFKWDSSEPLFQGEAFSKGVKYSFEMYAKDLSFKKFDRSTGDETWSEQYYNVLSR